MFLILFVCCFLFSTVNCNDMVVCKTCPCNNEQIYTPSDTTRMVFIDEGGGSACQKGEKGDKGDRGLKSKSRKEEIKHLNKTFSDETAAIYKILAALQRDLQSSTNQTQEDMDAIKAMENDTLLLQKEFTRTLEECYLKFEQKYNASYISIAKVEGNLRKMQQNFSTQIEQLNKKIEEQSRQSQISMAKLEKKLLELQEKLILGKVNSNMTSSNQTENCDDVYRKNVTTDGVYNITIKGKVVKVYCQFQRNGSNWMVFQRRINGQQDFYKNWNAYVKGFGNKTQEFWLGLETLHQLTSSGSYRLRVDLEDFSGNTAYADYGIFSIGTSSLKYPLNIGSYSGTAGDALSDGQNIGFSTFDQNNYFNISGSNGKNCAIILHGAWWFKSCKLVNLNGVYMPKDQALSGSKKGISWFSWKKNYQGMKRVEMKITSS